MSSRERVLTALDHQEPDRVPIDLWFTSEIEERLSSAHGGLRGAGLRVALGHDLVMTSSPNIGASYEIPGTPEEYMCEWGVRWRWITNAAGGRYTETVGHPLASVQDLVSYQMPDPLGPSMQGIYQEARDLVERYGQTHAIFGSLYQTVFEAAWLLRGMENLLVDMGINKDFAHELFERLTEYSLVAGIALIRAGAGKPPLSPLRAAGGRHSPGSPTRDEGGRRPDHSPSLGAEGRTGGIDVLWLGDDFGTQHAMLISPQMWREFIKPRYARLIAAFKAEKPDLKIAYHCDGYFEPIIPELIEIGLDVLNPVQPLAVDPAEIKRKYGDRLSFWGTVDTQRTFPFGSPLDVEREVRERLRTVAPGGGLILCSSHRVQPDAPMANIRAFYRAASQYGTYPIRL